MQDTICSQYVCFYSRRGIMKNMAPVANLEKDKTFVNLNTLSGVMVSRQWFRDFILHRALNLDG